MILTETSALSIICKVWPIFCSHRMWDGEMLYLQYTERSSSYFYVSYVSNWHALIKHTDWCELCSRDSLSVGRWIVFNISGLHTAQNLLVIQDLSLTLDTNKHFYVCTSTNNQSKSTEAAPGGGSSFEVCCIYRNTDGRGNKNRGFWLQ